MIWSEVSSSMPHSQIAEGAIPHLCMDEQICPTPVHGLFNFIHAGIGGTNPNGRGPASGIKERSLKALLHTLHTKRDLPTMPY